MGKVRKKIKVHIKVKGDFPRLLPVGAFLTVADNSGAKKLQIITVAHMKGRKRRSLSAGIADQVICSVVEGNPEMKHQVVPAVVIRQRKEFRRPNGEHVKFYDNAAVVVTPEGEMKGTEIRGPVAREAVQKWSTLAAAAKTVV